MAPHILITGATSGIGEACARQFAKLGYSLILFARREERLMKLKEEIEKMGVKVITLKVDVQIESQVSEALDSLPDEIKQNLAILINNAGLAVGRGPISEGIIDDWERMIDTNIKGLLYVSRHVVPIMQANQKDIFLTFQVLLEKKFMLEEMFIVPQSMQSMHYQMPCALI